MSKIHEYSSACWIGYIHPLTFIVPDGQKPWDVSLEEINHVSYNHGNLVRVIGAVQIEGSDLKGLICYDGAIVVPKFGTTRDKDAAVDFFNRLFAKLLISGFYTEGIDQRDVVSGSFYQDWAITNSEFGDSLSSRFHSTLRSKMVSNFDSIQLSNPRTIHVSELFEKIKMGESILNKIPNLTPKFLTKGITEIRYENWDLVLSNLWIVAEQIIDYLWFNHFINVDEVNPKKEIGGRKTSLKEDNRTWSAAVKQEILYQRGIIDETVLNNLYTARKIRNKLVHEGKKVDKDVVVSLFDAIKLLFTSLSGEKIAFDGLEMLNRPVYNGMGNHIDQINEWKILSEKFNLPKI